MSETRLKSSESLDPGWQENVPEDLIVETPTEYSKKTKTRKRNIYPEGVAVIDMALFTGDTKLTHTSSYNGLLDSFANKAEGDFSPVHSHGFSLTAGCAADEIADLLDGTAITIGETSNKWFSYLENLTQNQLSALLKADWKTRPADARAKYEICGLVYVGKQVAAMLSGMTKGQANKWALQSNPKTWLPRVHDPENRDTWRAHLITTIFGAITGNDKTIVKKTIMDLLEKEWKFPKEVYEMADKFWAGYIETDVIDEFSKNRQQIIHIFFGDEAIVDNPKTGDAETDRMYTIMTNLTRFFEKIHRTAKKLLYGPETPAWKEFADSISLQEMTFEWITTWPRLEVPWPIYGLRVHYDDPGTQYEFIQMDHVHATNKDLVDTALFTRVKSDNSEVGYYLNVFLLPGYTWDTVKSGMLFAWFFIGGYCDDNHAHDGTYEFDVDLGGKIAYYEAVETLDENNEVFETVGVDAYVLSDLNSDHWYGISPFNAIKDGDDSELSLFANMFKPRLLTESEVADPTPKASPVTHDNSNKKIQLTNELFEEFMSRRFVRIKLAAEFINRKWTRKTILSWHNPLDAPPQPTTDPKPPERTSKVSASDYSSTDDTGELEKLVADMRSEIEYYNKLGHVDQVKNRQITITKIEERIAQLKKQGTKPVTDADPDGDGQQGDD